MKSLLLSVLMLAFSSPAFAHREPVRPGHLVKVVATDAGPMAVYRNAAGCYLTLGGFVVDQVSLAVCNG